jgi:hypothetical protein
LQIKRANVSAVAEQPPNHFRQVVSFSAYRARSRRPRDRSVSPRSVTIGLGFSGYCRIFFPSCNRRKTPRKHFHRHLKLNLKVISYQSRIFRFLFDRADIFAIIFPKFSKFTDSIFDFDDDFDSIIGFYWFK